MNIGLVHPYLTYLLYFVIITGLVAWIGDFIKNKSGTILIALSISNILSLIGFSIINALFLVFVFSAGFFLNFDFLVNVIWIFVYLYCALEILKIFDEAFGDNKKYKLISKLIIIGPFAFSFVIFYFLYNGDNIYKISPHCENTKDPKIKVEIIKEIFRFKFKFLLIKNKIKKIINKPKFNLAPIETAKNNIANSYFFFL